jgi:hypothetical protein
MELKIKSAKLIGDFSSEEKLVIKTNVQLSIYNPIWEKPLKIEFTLTINVS